MHWLKISPFSSFKVRNFLHLYMHAHPPLQRPAFKLYSSCFLHAPGPQIQMSVAGLISPTSIASSLGPQGTEEAISLYCSQEKKRYFPNLCASPHGLWCFVCLFFSYSCTHLSDDLVLVIYKHPLHTSVCSSVSSEQAGSACINLNAYLYIKVSLLFFIFIPCVFTYISFCRVTLEVLQSSNKSYVAHPQPSNFNP